MTKDDLLIKIAEAGYNIGFGAKKHFSTFDIVDKTPGYISFFSMAFGIYALAYDGLSTKFLSASFIVLGIIGLYISLYDSKKNEYEQKGIELTKLFNELAKLYSHVKSSSDDKIAGLEQNLIDIENRYYAVSNSKQILFSDWYAHYKFFWQHQIEWVNEQKKFRFFRDKLPLTFSLAVLLVSCVSIYLVCGSLEALCGLNP